MQGKKVRRTTRKGHNSAVFIFVLLGELTAFAPIVTDMYLPSLPQLENYFGTSTSMVQMGLTSSMLGLALGQLLFGPLSDKYGRRRPLICSLILYLLSTVLCIFAATIELFVFWRFWQGIAAAGGIVIARSIATDKFKKDILAKALGLVGAIHGVAPIVAPIFGGVVLSFVGWKAVFVILLIVGLILFALCLRFNESLSNVRRSSGGVFTMIKGLPEMMKNKLFMWYVLEMSCALGVLFSYISSAPFIIQSHYGFKPFHFSLFFAANAVAAAVGAISSARIKPAAKAIKISCAGMSIAVLFLSCAMNFGLSVVFYESALLLMCFSLGMSLTVASAGAMEAGRAKAGTASAVLGAMGFLAGSIVSPLVGLGNMMVSTSIVLIICVAGACLCAYKAVMMGK